VARHRGKIIVKPLVFPSIFADHKTKVKNNRQNGQRGWWFIDNFSRRIDIENLGPIDSVAQLVRKIDLPPRLDTTLS